MLTDFKTVHPGCCPPHDNPPWEPPQVIPAQIRRVNNLIFRKINAFSRANGLEQGTPMHGWIVEYLYSHQNEPVFQRDIERDFSITRSTVTNILQLMERKGYIERQSVPQDARLKMLVLTAKGLEFLPPSDRRICSWAVDRGRKHRAAPAAQQTQERAE